MGNNGNNNAPWTSITTNRVIAIAAVGATLIALLVFLFGQGVLKDLLNGDEPIAQVTPSPTVPSTPIDGDNGNGEQPTTTPIGPSVAIDLETLSGCIGVPKDRIFEAEAGPDIELDTQFASEAPVALRLTNVNELVGVFAFTTILSGGTISFKEPSIVDSDCASVNSYAATGTTTDPDIVEVYGAMCMLIKDIYYAVDLSWETEPNSPITVEFSKLSDISFDPTLSDCQGAISLARE